MIFYLGGYDDGWTTLLVRSRLSLFSLVVLARASDRGLEFSGSPEPCGGADQPIMLVCQHGGGHGHHIALASQELVSISSLLLSSVGCG